jgi:hypothetical protein
VKEQHYWPVYWNHLDDDTTHIAFLDDEKIAKMMVKMFKALDVEAAVHPPVELNVFKVFPESRA